jgi:UDP-N-acetylmuramoyl-L-alanyl-D-glutamate--2,6-diaminopimelate ligase
MLGGKRIIIDFAHNGESFRAVLCAFGEARERRICVFGSVGERCKARRGELAAAAEKYCRLSFITADDPRGESVIDICRDIASHFSTPDSYRVCTDRKEAILAAIGAASAGDTVFLLGKGHERQQIIGTRAVPFSEREIILSLGAVPRYRSP